MEPWAFAILILHLSVQTRSSVDTFSSPVSFPTVNCITHSPTPSIFYDCNSDFIADSDCFDDFRYTCEACCYTDFSADGRRPCWTPDHAKIDCCGNGTDVIQTTIPESAILCDDLLLTARPSTTLPSVRPTSSRPSSQPSLPPLSSAPALQPSKIPIADCVTLPPSREVYYDCNSQFIADSDCFDSFRYTCEACCYTDFSADGRRPCWTPDHAKIDCCGAGSPIDPAAPVLVEGSYCGDQIPSLQPNSSPTSNAPSFIPSSLFPSQLPSFSPSTSIPSLQPHLIPTTIQPSATPFTLPTISLPSATPTMSYPSQSPVAWDCDFGSERGCWDRINTCFDCCNSGRNAVGGECWSSQGGYSFIDCCQMKSPSSSPLPSEPTATPACSDCDGS